MPVYLPGLTFGGLGYGGAAYGHSSYGGAAFPRSPIAVTSGYGGSPYGTGPYGSLDAIPPKVSSASSLDGFRVEIFFSEEMDPNPALTTPSNYTFTDVYGVPLTPLSVALGTPGSYGGYTSVIVTHSGSTLGGQYQVSVVGVQDLSGNPISLSSATFSSFGDVSQVQISFPSPDDGRTVVLDFENSNGNPQPLLAESVFSPGVDDVASYSVTTSYPAPPTLGSAAQDSSVLSRVVLDLHPMTSTTYNLTVGPAGAYTYDGSVLPDADPNLDGAELGSGTSSTSGTGLILSKSAGFSYGWSLGDTSGRLLTGTSFRADFTLDVSSASIIPSPLNSSVVTFSVSDGTVQIDLVLEDVSGNKVISVLSGALSLQVPAVWDLAETTVSLVRNMKGAFYALLVDGVPLLTFALSAPTGSPVYAAGTAVLLSAPPEINLFRLGGVDVSASATVFTDAWNFIHDLSDTFTGSSVLTRDRIRTLRGPLVRGWGDATPARKEDVTVRVEGTSVPVASINPYIGEIVLETPIPRTAPGTLSIDVDYIWASNPVFPMAGLNTPGLTLNTWSRPGIRPPGGVSGTTGAARTSRFPMSVVLQGGQRTSPKRIGHRFVGFQRGYSALLNSPTTLLLNQSPTAVSKGTISADALYESGGFLGTTTPEAAATPWSLVGTDTGALVGDGTYRLVDASTGSYGTGAGAYYKRDVDLSMTTQVTESGRFYVEEYTADGVFTGVGFGVHDGNQILLVGALLVGGVQHLGVLLDGENPHLEASWDIGPQVTGTATSQSTIQVPFADLPTGVSDGNRFRVASGNQAGVYTVSECGVVQAEDGLTYELTFSPELPADISGFGNDEPEMLFEIKWDSDLISVRTTSEFPLGGATVLVGGPVSGEVAVLTSLPAFPAQTALFLPATKKGVSFWGSLSRRATNQSIWDLVLYSSVPERLTKTLQGLTVQTEMNTLPPDDPNDPWYEVGGFGYAVSPITEELLLKATSSDPGIGLTFSYSRVEPFLTNKVSTDFEARFRVESGVLGAGDARVTILDGVREIILDTLLYTQDANSRSLVADLPKASLSGLRAPVDAGWTQNPSFGLQPPFVRGQTLEISKAATETGIWSRSLPDPSSVTYEGLVSEARFSVTSSTSGSVGIGFLFGVDVTVATNTVRSVRIGFDTGSILLLDGSLATIGTLAYAWDDEPHTYRILCDPVADTVVLLVDDVVIGGTPLSGFASSTGSAQAFLGAEGSGVCEVVLESTSAVPLRPVALPGSSLGRTLGIKLREGTGIDGYRIPRADTSSAANSSAVAIPVIMDWQNFLHTRLYLDPTWGVSLFRPDIPLPPSATGDFATETTDPTAAWATVEYVQLPVNKQDRGCVEFGAPDPNSISQQRWDFVRYRIRGAVDGVGIAPQGMVLNRYVTASSGEFLRDTTPQVVTITSRTSTLVYVPDSAMFADRVFVVQVDGAVLPVSDWGFDKNSQNLILNSPLPEDNHPVTVTFAPGRPVTKTYLCGEPIENSSILLNEGTPPFEKSWDKPATATVTAGTPIDDPDDDLDPAESLILTDPYQYVKFTDDPESRYADLDFCEVEEGKSVHLSSMCDGPGPETGLVGITIEGLFTTDPFSVPEGPGGPWGQQSPFIKGSASQFDPTKVLLASGGVVQGGTLGPGTAILYPNARGPSGNPPPGGMGLNQEIFLVIQEVSPREETWGIQGTLGDNVPPSSVSGDPNPDGTPGATGNGAAVYMMEDFAGATYSKLGPWGGLDALSVRSLLAGGSPLSGVELTLSGGSALPGPTVTTGQIEAAN